MSYIVVDTNVVWVADREYPAASAKCIASCVELLESVYKKGDHKLVLDWSRRILLQYLNKLSGENEGIGSAFVEWLRDHWGNIEFMELVTVTRDNGSFKEFPEDTEARKFHHKDHVFVAVARAHPEKPTIYDATDSDWHDHYKALSRFVRIEFLCPDVVAHP